MRSENIPDKTTLLDKMRIDKWLWCARFYKTRSLATQAVEAGKVRLDRERVKPARDIKAGDQLFIQVGELIWEIEILSLSLQRSSATIAHALYREDDASVLRRQQQIAAQKAATHSEAQIRGRPTKRNRRQIRRFMDN